MDLELLAGNAPSPKRIFAVTFSSQRAFVAFNDRVQLVLCLLDF